MQIVQKIADRIRRQGLEQGLRTLATDAAQRVVEERSMIVMRVDLTDAKNRLRERDRRGEPIVLLPFDRSTLPRVLAMAEANEPWRVDSARRRLIEGASGFVAEHRGETIGYLFWVDGTDHPERIVHGDLRWLGVRPRRGEIYAFDYYLIEPARGLGAEFARTVQEEHFRMGYTAAYGWVLATNRPALWLYRTTGWQEVARVFERRLMSRVAVVDKTVYWLEPWSRRPIARLP